MKFTVFKLLHISNPLPKESIACLNNPAAITFKSFVLLQGGKCLELLNKNAAEELVDQVFNEVDEVRSCECHVILGGTVGVSFLIIS